MKPLTKILSEVFEPENRDALRNVINAARSTSIDDVVNYNYGGLCLLLLALDTNANDVKEWQSAMETVERDMEVVKYSKGVGVVSQRSQKSE